LRQSSAKVCSNSMPGASNARMPFACTGLTRSTSGHAPGYRVLPLKSNVGCFKSECKCRGSAAPKPSASLVAVAEVHFGKSVPPRSANGSCSSGRNRVEHRLHVPRCTAHARSGSGQGWSRLPVLRRSARRLGILRRSNSMPVPARRFCRASLVPKRNFGLACHREARAHLHSSKPQFPRRCSQSPPFSASFAARAMQAPNPSFERTNNGRPLQALISFWALRVLPSCAAQLKR
jgi:hypothetical protein